MKVETFVLKIVSRCNLNCSYCYMYNKGDTTFELQPKLMEIETIKDIAKKIDLHVKRHDIKTIFIVYHGGEPMIAGKFFFIDANKIFNKYIDVKINYAIQTNGTLIDKDWVSLFNNLEIKIGISIDGPKKYHDSFRVFHNKKGSYDVIMNKFKKELNIKDFGFLFVINPIIPVNELYSFIKKNKIGTLNLLLPDYHYDDLPHYLNHNIKLSTWLTSFYKLWKNDKNRPVIDFFENIIKSFFDLSNGTQILGSCFNSVVCIETDGSIEVIDSLRTCQSGITRNNLKVKNNAIDDIFELSIYKQYYYSHTQVSKKCNECEYLKICGGGFLPHRYSKKNEFDNPSIYCNDLFEFIKYIELDIKKEIKKHEIN
ncbi:radical SAM protein [Flavobacterium oreochromis]|uniref:radical SAM protein n=1 Tax=Flavobacterium oreochromis TaxID=2906078 RepID=UPI00385A67E7